MRPGDCDRLNDVDEAVGAGRAIDDDPALAAHLAECPSCQRVLRRMGQASRILGELPARLLRPGERHPSDMLLAAYVAQGLRPRGSDLVEAHLAECDECVDIVAEVRQRLDEADDLWPPGGSTPGPSEPPGGLQGLLAELALGFRTFGRGAGLLGSLPLYVLGLGMLAAGVAVLAAQAVAGLASDASVRAWPVVCWAQPGPLRSALAVGLALAAGGVAWRAAVAVYAHATRGAARGQAQVRRGALAALLALGAAWGALWPGTLVPSQYHSLEVSAAWPSAAEPWASQIRSDTRSLVIEAMDPATGTSLSRRVVARPGAPSPALPRMLRLSGLPSGLLRARVAAYAGPGATGEVLASGEALVDLAQATDASAVALSLAFGGGGILCVTRHDAAARYSVELIDAAGQVLRGAPPESGRNAMAALSPDGQRLAYCMQGDDGVQSLYVRELRSGRTSRLTHGPTDDAPSWSPDGRRIVFSGLPPGRAAGARDLYVIGADGNGRRPLTTDPADDAWPDWSPDGRKVAFCSNRASREVYALYALDPDRQQGATRIRAEAQSLVAPAWSPDGARLSFHIERNAEDFMCLFGSMRADGTGPIDYIGPGLNADWSPDGSHLVYTGESAQPGIFVVPADGSGEPSQIVPSPGPGEAVGWPRWAGGLGAAGTH